MITRIDTIENLNKVCKREKSVSGNGWIYNLVILYLEKKFDKKNIEVKSTCIFFVGQEKKCFEMANRAESENAEGEYFYLGMEVKNELDRIMAFEYPNEYEERVFIQRKKELDVEKTNEFKQIIREFDTAQNVPLFTSIEIETINRCNGECAFCPVNKNLDSREFKKMSGELFENIIDQLASLNYSGRIALNSNNEPFMDNRIFEFAKYTKEKLPQATKIIFTNGTLVSYEKFCQIIDYLDIINFDCYYENEYSDGITDELIKIMKACQNNNDWKHKVMFLFINKNAIRNNRGGISGNRRMKYRVKAPCILPFIQMIVRPDGKTSLCCNDALGKITLADLNKESLIEAWNNNKYQRMRELISDSRQNIHNCVECDNYASLNTNGTLVFSQEQIKDSWNIVERIVREILSV